MADIKYRLRWLAVVPGALLVGFLLTFPLHWALYTTLTNFVDPYPELPEQILNPAVIAGGVVWSGALIAPDRQIETAVVLFGLWMVLLGGFAALTLFDVNVAGRQFFFQGGGIAPAMAFVGGLVGLLVVRKKRTAAAWRAST